MVALVTAALLDSHALLRAGEGMTPGHTRSTTLAVAQPLDRFAESTGLNRPRSAFDDALGRDDSAGGVITGGVVPPPLPAVPEPSVDVLPGPGAISSSVPAASDSTSAAGHPSSPAPATSPAKGRESRSGRRPGSALSRCSSPVTRSRRTSPSRWTS